jgi:hypothetical protein
MNKVSPADSKCEFDVMQGHPYFPPHVAKAMCFQGALIVPAPVSVPEGATYRIAAQQFPVNKIKNVIIFRLFISIYLAQAETICDKNTILYFEVYHFICNITILY